MVIDDEVLEQMRDKFGLNLYEARVWAALLSRGICTAGEISELGGVPRSRAYDVLETLEKKGFVVMKLGKPIKYLAIDPSEIVERLRKRVNKDYEERHVSLEKLDGSDLMGKLDTLYNEGIRMLDPTEMSSSLKGRYNIHDHLELMMNDAIKSIDIVTTEEGLNRLAEYHLPVIKGASERGVKVKIAAPITRHGLAASKYLLEFAGLRHMDHIKARFNIIDNEEVMFMIMPDISIHPTYDTGIWIHSPFFAKALADLFEHTWEHLEHANKVIKKIEAEED